MNAAQQSAYQSLLNDLSLGRAGRNQHALRGDRAGWLAADLPGSGGGRGRMRIIYRQLENHVEVLEIVDYH